MVFEIRSIATASLALTLNEDFVRQHTSAQSLIGGPLQSYLLPPFHLKVCRLDLWLEVHFTKLSLASHFPWRSVRRCPLPTMASSWAFWVVDFPSPLIYRSCWWTSVTSVASILNETRSVFLRFRGSPDDFSIAVVSCSPVLTSGRGRLRNAFRTASV